jgi:translation initiation factor 1 (eIF-1/SUI1)
MAQLLSINDAVHKRKPVASAADEAGAVVGSTEGGKTEGAVEEPKQAPKKPRAPKVVVSRQQRSKRKFLTVVSGLELYKVDAKEACSAFKKKFACGVSQGSDGIEIQVRFSRCCIVVHGSRAYRLTSRLG